MMRGLLTRSTDKRLLETWPNDERAIYVRTFENNMSAEASLITFCLFQSFLRLRSSVILLLING